MSAERVTSRRSSFGTLLRRYREAAGLTQEELASKAGLSSRGISDLERGLRTMPRSATVEMLAEALALSTRQRSLLASAARPLATSRSTKSDSTTVPLHNIPSQLSPLVGRERDVERVSSLLAQVDVRLCTLTGPGGVGKTRLALYLAEELLYHFEDGVTFVQLAPLRDPALVASTITEALGIHPIVGFSTEEQLYTYLENKRSLLVLNNFEHLLTAAATLASLLVHCPWLKVLVTSREPLRLDGEYEIAVRPLDTPASVELFRQRAQAVCPELEMTPANQECIAAICRRVDCLPLAIELAAVWVKVLPLPDLLERLCQPLQLLTSGRRDSPERQQSLRETIAWSDRLLSTDERRLFWQLSIFVGGCDLKAVEVVADVPATLSILQGMGRLVDKHLLQAETHQGEPRFWMLETIREYALEELRASGELDGLLRRHAGYFLDLARTLAWVGPGQEERDHTLERELPNIRAAMLWANERGEREIGLSLAVSLGRYWFSRGALNEGAYWLSRFLASTESGEHTVPSRLRVRALYFAVLIALDQQDFDRAEALAHEGEALARGTGYEAGVGDMLVELGHVAEARGELDAAMRYFEESLTHYDSSETQGAVGRALSSLGNLARAKGDFVRARYFLERALDWVRERQFPWAVAGVVSGLGFVACEEGNFPLARAQFRESLQLYSAWPSPSALAWCLEGVIVCIADRDSERAARLVGAVHSLRSMVHIGPVTTTWQPLIQACETVQNSLGTDGFTDAYQDGAAFSVEQAVKFAITAVQD